MGRSARLRLLASLCASHAAVAWAQVPARPQVSLAWSAPADCPTRAAVLDRVDRLRTRSSRPGSAPFAAASVTRTDDGRWSLDLQTATPDGPAERTLVADSCANVAEAAALILALSLDDAAARPQPSPAQPSPPRSLSPGTPVDVALRASFVLDGTTLPSAAPGVSVALAVVRDRLRLEVGAAYLFSRRAVNASNVGGDIALVSAGLRGCVTLFRGLVEPRVCAAVEGGSMMGSGVGIATPASGSSPWWGLFGGAALAWNLSPHLSLYLGVDAGVSLSSPEFVIEEVGPVHRPSTALVRGGFGVEWRF